MLRRQLKLMTILRIGVSFRQKGFVYKIPLYKSGISS